MNNELQLVQEKWFNDIFLKSINVNNDFSYPFYFGVSREYKEATKRVMIVGQETSGFTKFNNDWSIMDSRQWSIDYYNHQIGNKTSNYFQNNSSPFWKLFSMFNKNEIIPSWNNVDKAQRVIENKSCVLTEKMESLLNTTFDDGSTLLLKEIEITKPNVVLFVTGPNYKKTMQWALNLENDTLKSIRPNKTNPCVDITNYVNLGIPVFWSYHPKYLNIIHELDKTVEKVLNSI